MNADIEAYIKQNYPWSKLPNSTKQSLGNSQREYERAVVNFSVKNQLRYKGNLVRHVRKDEKKYYEGLLQYSREHLMLYPFHLSDVIVKGLRTTPFAYYIGIMTDIMTQEKSYDSLPNFTAADCLRLMGIGRNQYIDLMNQCRSSKKFFRRKPVKDLLPAQPIENIFIDSWWIVHAGYITEEDIRLCMLIEKTVIDSVIDKGPRPAGTMDYKVVNSLYRKGLIYLEVPISDDDCIIVPPLEGFVMNRVLGDYFETLLYKIFVSIDEHTTVAELASVLQIDLQLVKNAVSMYCRLGFAKKKNLDTNVEDLHQSWKEIPNQNSKKPSQDQMLIDWSTTLELTPGTESSSEQETTTPDTQSLDGALESSTIGHSKRIAFLFDSTLTAFLMMGNLSPGLKSHAVTMFEVGKLSDESLESFISELDKVDSVAEGEAQRYFDHAITLRDTIKFLRFNKDLSVDGEGTGLGIDLLRCESLLGLDPATCSRVLNKNYSLLFSMAPLSNEVRPISSCTPQHIGPAIPEVNSMWFKMYAYHTTGSGPASLMLSKGTKLRRLPRMFHDYDRLLVTTWGHDPGVIPTSNILLTLNDALSHSAVLVQAHGWQSDGETIFVPFPINKQDKSGAYLTWNPPEHSAIQDLSNSLDLAHSCGFITLLRTGKSGENINPRTSNRSRSSDSQPKNGLKDHDSAKVLALEIDSVNDSTNERGGGAGDAPPSKQETPMNKADFSLDIGEETGLAKDSDQADWTLLDCSFGLPLFDSCVNKQVCERIAAHGLCRENSLEKLLQSSRTLSLNLLSFISEHQKGDVLEDNGHMPGESREVPLPANNLAFYKGELSVWDGH